MKLFIFACIAVFALFACTKDKEPKPEPIVESNTYSGTLTVINNDVPEESNIDIEIITTARQDSLILFLKKARFINAMPVGLDIKIPVTSTKENNITTLSGTEITPFLVAGEVDSPFPHFRIDDLSGKLTANFLNVTMKMIAVNGMGQQIPAGTVFQTSFNGEIKTASNE